MITMDELDLIIKQQIEIELEKYLRKNISKAYNLVFKQQLEIKIAEHLRTGTDCPDWVYAALKVAKAYEDKMDKE